MKQGVQLVIERVQRHRAFPRLANANGQNLAPTLSRTSIPVSGTSQLERPRFVPVLADSVTTTQTSQIDSGLTSQVNNAEQLYLEPQGEASSQFIAETDVSQDTQMAAILPNESEAEFALQEFGKHEMLEPENDFQTLSAAETIQDISSIPETTEPQMVDRTSQTSLEPQLRASQPEVVQAKTQSVLAETQSVPSAAQPPAIPGVPTRETQTSPKPSQDSIQPSNLATRETPSAPRVAAELNSSRELKTDQRAENTQVNQMPQAETPQLVSDQEVINQSNTFENPQIATSANPDLENKITDINEPKDVQTFEGSLQFQETQLETNTLVSQSAEQQSPEQQSPGQQSPEQQNPEQATRRLSRLEQTLAALRQFDSSNLTPELGASTRASQAREVPQSQVRETKSPLTENSSAERVRGDRIGAQKATGSTKTALESSEVTNSNGMEYPSSSQHRSEVPNSKTASEPQAISRATLANQSEMIVNPSEFGTAKPQAAIQSEAPLTEIIQVDSTKRTQVQAASFDVAQNQPPTKTQTPELEIARNSSNPEMNRASSETANAAQAQSEKPQLSAEEQRQADERASYQRSVELRAARAKRALAAKEELERDPTLELETTLEVAPETIEIRPSEVVQDQRPEAIEQTTKTSNPETIPQAVHPQVAQPETQTLQKLEAREEFQAPTRVEGQSANQAEKSQLEIQAERQPQARVEVQPETRVENQPRTQAEARAEDQAESRLEGQVGTRAGNKSQTSVEYQPQTRAEDQLETQGEAQTQMVAQSEIRAENYSETQVEVQSGVQAEPQLEVQGQAQLETRAEGQPQSRGEDRSNPQTENPFGIQTLSQSQARAEPQSETRLEDQSETGVENQAQVQVENQPLTESNNLLISNENSNPNKITENILADSSSETETTQSLVRPNNSSGTTNAISNTDSQPNSSNLTPIVTPQTPASYQQAKAEGVSVYSPQRRIQRTLINPNPKPKHEPNEAEKMFAAMPEIDVAALFAKLRQNVSGEEPQAQYNNLQAAQPVNPKVNRENGSGNSSFTDQNSSLVPRNLIATPQNNAALNSVQRTPSDASGISSTPQAPNARGVAIAVSESQTGDSSSEVWDGEESTPTEKAMSENSSGTAQNDVAFDNRTSGSAISTGSNSGDSAQGNVATRAEALESQTPAANASIQRNQTDAQGNKIHVFDPPRRRIVPPKPKVEQSKTEAEKMFEAMEQTETPDQIFQRLKRQLEQPANSNQTEQPLEATMPAGASYGQEATMPAGASYGQEATMPAAIPPEATQARQRPSPSGAASGARQVHLWGQEGASWNQARTARQVLVQGQDGAFDGRESIQLTNTPLQATNSSFEAIPSSSLGRSSERLQPNLPNLDDGMPPLPTSSSVPMRLGTSFTGNAPVQLGQTARRFLKASVGIDPNDVNIYQDAQSNHLTNAARADALAIGDTILLSSGQALESPETLGVIAHELTHVARNRQARFVPAVARNNPNLQSSAAAGNEEGLALGVEALARQGWSEVQNPNSTNQNNFGSNSANPSSQISNQASSFAENESRFGSLPAPSQWPEWFLKDGSPPQTTTPSTPTPSTPTLSNMGYAATASSMPPPIANTMSQMSVQAAAQGRDVPTPPPAAGPLPPSQGPKSEPNAKSAAPDLDAMARQVYSILKRRLANERYRS